MDKTKFNKDLILKSNRKNKDILLLECEISTQQKEANDLNEKLLQAIADEKFLKICKNHSRKEFILYLIQHEILQLETPRNTVKNNTRMGWFHTDSNIYSDINLVVEGGAVAVTLVAAAAEAVVAVAVYVAGKPSERSNISSDNLLRNELFKRCVRVAGKLGGISFRDDIYILFKELENGNQVTL